MSHPKILAIMARYPPYHGGGYEIRSKDIINELVKRGFKIIIISTIVEKGSKALSEINEYDIYRKLHIRKNSNHFIKEIFFDYLDVSFLEKIINSYQPDVVYLGHIVNMSKALIPFLAYSKIPIIYDEGGIGLLHSWKNRGKWFYFVEEFNNRNYFFNILKKYFVTSINKLSGSKLKTTWEWPQNISAFFNSKSNYLITVSKGIPLVEAKYIHSGIYINKFSYKPRNKLNLPISIIVPGRIESQKGQKDSIELLAQMKRNDIDARLVIVGEISSTLYFSEIKDEITRFELEDSITILKMVTQEKLNELYQNSDLCFFPSYQIAGFSRIPLEAMACGCLTFSYGFEGSDEIINNEKNGFIVNPKDFSAIVEILKRALSDQIYYKQIISNARIEIETIYPMEKYIDKIETLIKEFVKSND